MPTPDPSRPLRPAAGGDRESDESLAAGTRDRPETDAAASVALLTARHWQAAHDYAALCLASSSQVAAMVTAAALHRVLDRVAHGESAVALRPRLLVSVRDTVREWAADGRVVGTLPDLRKPSGGRGMRATKSPIPENRALAAHAFAALPAQSRCLLWHVEVESEHISVPATLLGMDDGTASATLTQAREKFRDACAYAHEQLAPGQDCRFYNRLLDAPIRRGGKLLPDVEEHLAVCRHCRHTADQLALSEKALGSLLAEAVLGWGARRYLESRPGRVAVGARGQGGARHRRGPAGLWARLPLPARRGARSARSALRAVGAVSAGALVTMLVVNVWSYDGGRADPAVSTGVPDGGGESAEAGAAGFTSAPPGVPGQSRLRNAGAGLCLDVDGEPGPGTGVRLAGCSDAMTQQWTYEEDGSVRSVADPGLCLDSRADAGVVLLGTCAREGTARAEDVRYAATARGELLPLWRRQLALAATAEDADADIVVKVRDGSEAQMWQAETTLAPSATPEPEAGSSAPPSAG
ncbi:RICIN domain-containing protein [Streptomyces sp. WMMC905]|uniref:RICIN domain-containing protein n=1 Tax=Streptomyces sp. WMMC905 TaxID=3404123 RepID=UPI003B93CFD4